MLPRVPESLILEAWALACLAQIGLVMLLALGKAGNGWQCLSPLVPWRIMVCLRASWRVEWSFWFCGSRCGVWENPSIRPHTESVDKLRKICYWGVQFCYSSLLVPDFLLQLPSCCILISALCCCFFIVFRPVPISENCVFSVKLFAQNKKETDFCFILPGPLQEAGSVDCKDLFAWCVTDVRRFSAARIPLFCCGGSFWKLAMSQRIVGRLGISSGQKLSPLIKD